MARMRKRPYLGRVGAGLLIALAGFASGEALNSTERQEAGAARVAVATPRPSLGTGGFSRATYPAETPAEVEEVAVIPPGRASVRVPILMYHYIRVNPDAHDRLGYDLSVTPEDFQRQMDWLADNHYHPVGFEELRGYFLGHGTLPTRPVVITLDDGYRDLYTEAYPVLRAHGFKAVAYIVTGFLDSPNNVSRQQLLEMQAHGIQVGSHTVSHPDLTRLPAGEVRRQLEDSKATLESLLGHPVVDFCYPGGTVNQAVVEAVRAAGYLTATTTASGITHSASDRYVWTRVRVRGGEALGQFVAGLGQEEPAAIEYQPRQLPAFVPTFPSRPPVAPPLELPPEPTAAAAAPGARP